MSDKSTILTFDMEENAYPLNEKIVLRSGVAAFENQLVSVSTSSPDVTFLSSVAYGNCAHGACDCAIYPFICVPQRPFVTLPMASQVLAELHIVNFQSEHIANLDTTYIPFPGYHSDTKNDEIHTDPGKQYLFSYEMIDNEFADYTDEFENLSRASHKALRSYVMNHHLFYILVHDKPKPHGEFMFSTFVLLFAVGVSPSTGNLVGAVSHQACHNLCD